MIPTRIALDPDLYDHATEVARRQDISLAELCRRALSREVARYPEDTAQDPKRRPWMAYLGSLEGRSGDSLTVDQVVYGRDAS